MNRTDESREGGTKKEDAEAPEVNTDRGQGTCSKLADRPTASTTDPDASAAPKRKLSVFYRSFDILTQIDRTKEKSLIEEIRRTCNSPSDRVGRLQESETVPRNGEIGQQTCFHKKGFVNSCCSLIESGKFFGNSAPERHCDISCPNNAEVTKATSPCPTTCKLHQVKEDTIGDNYASINDTSIGEHYTLNSNGSCEVKAVDGNVATDSRQNASLCILTNTAESSGDEKIENAGTSRAANATTDHRRGNSPHTRPICSRGITRTDLVKIKDTEYPRSFVNASSAGRRGKYTSVDAEMSSHEDSSIGSDSEDESIGRSNVHAARQPRHELEKIDGRRSKSNSPSLSQPLPSFSGCETLGKLDDVNGVPKVEKIEDIVELCGKRDKRQAAFAARRSLSEGDCERYHRVKRRFRCTKEKDVSDERDHYPAFPSFNDTRLQIMGLSKAEDVDSLYRENIPETELERKYIAFSIGLCTDRITLYRRMALALRQRDQAERNFRNEIRKMQEDIQDLCPLCTDQESIDKVSKVRDRLDMIERSVHSISCAAETLGAVHQEHRISRAIYTGDKYLQLLRTKCEHLATEITETKQILWKNNIVIEETSGEIGDDLPKIRYRNGLSSSNRTMVARRRASIATISRPLNSQDMIKETPRCCSQRNSVSGRVTLRRPSLCSEIQSASSVIELRDIFEHTESRRNSVEENNNLLRIDETNSVNVTKSDVLSNTESKDRLFTNQNSLLESNVTKTVENQLKLCIRTAEPLRITRSIEAWQPILWYTLIFFIGFYAKQITSTFDTCDVAP